MEEFYTPFWWEEYWQKRQRKRRFRMFISLLTKPLYAIPGILLLLK
jgi:hypothetical protein